MFLQRQRRGKKPATATTVRSATPATLRTGGTMPHNTTAELGASQQLASKPEDVVPYNIHVSSKYLDLTKRKLELTRLPHEILGLPKEREWEYGTPKNAIEPLVDYWLESYDWRARETHLNTALPQFRTTLAPPPEHQTIPHPPPASSPTASTSPTIAAPPPHPPLRIHFIHAPSRHSNAIPLLFLHSSFGVLEVTKIIELLTDPAPSTTSTTTSPDRGADSTDDIELGITPQAFHVVAPSLPGFGFGDASREPGGVGLRGIAAMWDSLMRRLGYDNYVAVGEGSEWGYPLLRTLSLHHPDTCLATHIHTPIPTSLLPPPRFWSQPAIYIRFLLARLSRASLFRFGYSPSDFPLSPPPPSQTSSFESLSEHPQTAAYALTDSPTGLLATMLARLQTVTSALEKEDIIDLTMMTWLPGPEAALRWTRDLAPHIPTINTGYSRTPMGVSLFGGYGGRGIAPVGWLSGVQRVPFVRKRGTAGDGGWIIWEKGGEVVRDWREFFGGIWKDRATEPAEVVVAEGEEVD